MLLLLKSKRETVKTGVMLQLMVSLGFLKANLTVRVEKSTWELNRVELKTAKR